MSDPREQSYYEIALTNRQVMTVFVVLLICVLAAFLGGVWVGRGNDEAVTTAEAQEIDSGVQPGEPPLEEMDFFAEEAEPADSPTPAPESEVVADDTQQPVILEDIGRRTVQPQLPAGDPAPTTPTPTPSPPPTSTARPTTTPAAGSATGSSTGEALVVQVFSSTDQQQAQRVVERLRGGGYPVAVSSVDVNGRATYRVRVGPYSDREEAQGVADRIRRTYKLETWITR